MVKIIEKAGKALKNKYLGYVMKNFALDCISHPYLMSREISKFSTHWLLGSTQEPAKGLKFEQHSHSHFSDGAELGSVVDFLFDNDFDLWSLTDHGNTNAFDSLQDGSYDLNSNSQRRYEHEVSSDGRDMTIQSDGKNLVLLRSIEYWTDKGEIGIHGFSGKLPNKRIPLDEAISRAKDGGAYVVIHHPYFWEGLGYHGRGTIETALAKGAIAIEKNGTEIPPQIYSAVRAEVDAKHFGVPLVTSGDAHNLDMYGLSGITFDESKFDETQKRVSQHPVDAIKSLIRSGEFETYFNYLKPKQFLNFFSFSDKKEA